MRLWRGLGRTVLDFALPPRCPACRAIGDEPHLFCGDCWGRLHWLQGGCARCGLPLEAGAMDECAGCQASPPPFRRIRSAVGYGDIPKRLVTRFKYGRKVGLATTLARAMATLVEGEDAVLVRSPLHRSRLWWRGFNQSLLLARALEKDGKGRVDAHLLRRHRHTRSLRGLSGAPRRAETDGAFRVADGRRDLKDLRIILVDDVLTTRSTADACARALRKAGATHIELLTFTRVVGLADKDQGPGDKV